MFLAAVAFVVREWKRLGCRAASASTPCSRPAPSASPSCVVLVATALLTTVWVVRTGHEGAKATWNTLPAASASAGGDHD